MKKLTDAQVRAILQQMSECSKRIENNCFKILSLKHGNKKAA